MLFNQFNRYLNVDLYASFSHCIRYQRQHAGSYVSFTASAAGSFGATAGNAPRLSNKAAAAAGHFGDGAAPVSTPPAASAAQRPSGVRQPAAASTRRLPVPAATAAARPPTRRRVGAVVASTTRLVLRMQRRADSRRRPAAPAPASCVSISPRISFLTLALRDKLCNDSYDHSLIISYNLNLKEGMRRERYLLDMLQGSKCRNIT